MRRVLNATLSFYLPLLEGETQEEAEDRMYAILSRLEPSACSNLGYQVHKTVVEDEENV